MARRPRSDGPGTWHHVMNRALARRALFETRGDMRHFLACIARAVRRGTIELHAFCVLSNHFHLLLRSPTGELSAAMRRIQTEYVRRFNRIRRRDGPLVRGRYRSKAVRSFAYRRQLVRYIDQNPVQAGLCADPRAYEWGSARCYATASGPPWLCRDWVEGRVAFEAGRAHYDPVDYPGTAPDGWWHAFAPLVESRLAARGSHDELDSVLTRRDARGDTWIRSAERADGGPSPLPIASAPAVSSRIEERRLRDGAWRVHGPQRRIDGWQPLLAGLLRDLARASFPAIAKRLGVSTAAAHRLAGRHRELLQRDGGYRRAAASVTREILDRTYGAGSDLPADPADTDA